MRVPRNKYPAEGFLVKYKEYRFAVRQGIAVLIFTQTSLNFTANDDSVLPANCVETENLKVHLTPKIFFR